MKHRLCLKYMYENFKQKFKGNGYKKLLWAVVFVGTEKHFELHMEKMKEMDENAYRWCMQHDPHTWARCYLSTHAKLDAL